MINSIRLTNTSETAYGAPTQLPPRGEVDLLIAGFACVDFSRLNSRPKSLNVGDLCTDGRIDSDAENSGGSRAPRDATGGISQGKSKRSRTKAIRENSAYEKGISDCFETIRQDDGESSATFQAIVKYAKDYRPPLIILENIKHAPWDVIQEAFHYIEYSAHHVIVDTKRYYLPHTRQRGYMLCVDNTTLGHEETDCVVQAWGQRMCDFERMASSPVEAFLLPEANSTLKAALSEMVQKAESGEGIRSDIDWSLSQNRHLEVRVREKLGDGSPYTNWSSGKATMPTYAHVAWGKSQPDRVKEMLDMLKLGDAKRGEDFEFKAFVHDPFSRGTANMLLHSRYPDVSQNVDRMMGRGNAGITGCLTPAGTGFSSLRGRPIVGLEALSLQGLSSNHLHLTRESQRELQDLAGNAMSSTVVGAAILSTMIVSGRCLLSEQALWNNKHESVLKCSQPAPIQEEKEPEEKLRLEVANLGNDEATVGSEVDLCRLAWATRRLCHCEGQDQVAKVPVYICSDCGATACRNCKEIPKHNYAEKPIDIERRDPRLFIQAIRNHLPTTLRIAAQSPSLHHDIRNGLGMTNVDDRSSGLQSTSRGARAIDCFLSGLESVLEQSMHIRQIHRSDCWKVRYESSISRLELIVGGHALQWELFVKPVPSLPSKSPERSIFKRPVARTVSATSFANLLGSRWELLVPLPQRMKITISGVGNLISSWKTDLGLEDVDSLECQVHEGLEIRPNQDDLLCLHHAITGTYELLPACGTANRALHVRRATPGHDEVFLLLDPEPYSPAEDDEFVFTTKPQRLEYDENRHVLARIGKVTSTTEPAQGVSRKWTPSDVLKGPTSAYVYVDTFQREVGFQFCTVAESATILRTLCGDIRDVSWTVSSPINCNAASFTLLTCQLPRLDTEIVEWNRSGLTSISERNERTIRVELTWLSMGLKELSDASQRWSRFHVDAIGYNCHSCAPQRPTVKWVEVPIKTSRGRRIQDERSQQAVRQEGEIEARMQQNRISPLEDPAETGPYESALKSRPSPFSIRFEKENAVAGEAARVSIALNFQTLAHRAIGNLSVHSRGKNCPVETFWRLNTVLVEAMHEKLQTFTIPNNKEDKPRNFKFSARNRESGSTLKLRDDQARSLKWMTARDTVHCAPFFEEIVEECTCTKLDWRLEVRATRSFRARGGIVADDVGFGKTVTSLALVKDRLADAAEESKLSTSRLIPIRATLIIAPPTLVPQWKDEISKFWPSCKLLHVHDVANLRRRTIGDFENADIVLISLSLLSHERYYERLADFAALPSVPVLNGPREHAAWFSLVTGRIERFAARLRQGGTPSGFASFLEQKSRDYKGGGTVQNAIPSRRLKGKEFEKHQRARAAAVTTQSQQLGGQPGTPSRQILGFESTETYSNALFPVFSLFEFHRKIVDEHTYVDGTQLKEITSVCSRATWILSGTPYIRDFADIKRMALFLGVFLGVDDDTPGYAREDNARALRSTRTGNRDVCALVTFAH